jgi:hypothetical protein
MEDPEGNNGSENRADEVPEQPAAEGQPDLFQDEDDFLTADHVFLCLFTHSLCWLACKKL